jgi:hypothetical protein
MVRLALLLALSTAPADAPTSPANPSTPTRPPAPRGEPGGWGWLTDPRSAVLLTLASVLLIGGGRKLLKTLEARRASARLAEPDVTVDEILDSARHGREGLIDLFRLLGTASDAPRREAAGRAIAALWKQDNLIAEEEKALVRRGFAVDWKARRRYPRGLNVPTPIRVDYGVPFLRDQDGEVGPSDLAWSHRIVGAERASLEEYSPWVKGGCGTSFTINPGDFSTNGPHRLVLQARVKTEGLTDPWEIELPHVPFSFEFDPILSVDALLAMPDESRSPQFASAMSLRPVATGNDGHRDVVLSEDFLLRDPPALVVSTPLPCDLAHAIQVEFEGVSGRYPAGSVVLSGQGVGGESVDRFFPIDLESRLPAGAIERPGEVHLRVVLTADAQSGWANPDVRSIWPGTITTDWATARVVRR